MLPCESPPSTATAWRLPRPATPCTALSRPGTPFGAGESRLLPSIDVDEDTEGAALAAMTARGVAQSPSSLGLEINWRPRTADASRDQLVQMMYKERAERKQAQEALHGLRSEVQRLSCEVEERAEDIQELEENQEILQGALRERTESEKKAERDARLQNVVFRARSEKQKQACEELSLRCAEARREIVAQPPQIRHEGHRPVSREEALDSFRTRLLSLLNDGGSTSWTRRPATSGHDSSRVQPLAVTTDSMKDSPPSVPGTADQHVSGRAQLLATTSSMQDSPPSELNSSAQRALAAMQDVVIDHFPVPCPAPCSESALDVLIKEVAPTGKSSLQISVEQTPRTEFKVISSNQSTCTPSSEMILADEASPTPMSSCEQVDSQCEAGHQGEPADDCRGLSSGRVEILQHEVSAPFSDYYRKHFMGTVAEGIARSLFHKSKPATEVSAPFSEYYCKHFATAPIVDSMARNAAQEVSAPFSEYYCKHFATAPIVDSMARNVAQPSAPFSEYYCKHFATAPIVDSMARNAAQVSAPFSEYYCKHFATAPIVDSIARNAAQVSAPFSEYYCKHFATAPVLDSMARRLADQASEPEASAPFSEYYCKHFVAAPALESMARRLFAKAEPSMNDAECSCAEPVQSTPDSSDAVEDPSCVASARITLQTEEEPSAADAVCTSTEPVPSAMTVAALDEDFKEEAQHDEDESEEEDEDDDDEEDEEEEDEDEEEEEEEETHTMEEQSQNKARQEESVQKMEEQKPLQETNEEAELETVVALDASASEEDSASEDESESDGSSDSDEESEDSGSEASSRAEEQKPEMSATAIWRGNILKTGITDSDAEVTTAPKAGVQPSNVGKPAQAVEKQPSPLAKPPTPQENPVVAKSGMSGRSNGALGSGRSSGSQGRASCSREMYRAASEGRVQWGTDARTGVSHVHPIAPLKLQPLEERNLLSRQPRGPCKKNVAILSYDQAQVQALKRSTNAKPPAINSSLPNLGLRQRSDAQLKVHLERDIVHVVELERKPYVRRGKKESERDFVSRRQNCRMGVMQGLYGPLCQMKVSDRDSWADNDRDHRDKGSLPRVQSLPSISATRSPPGARMEARSFAYASPQRLTAVR